MSRLLDALAGIAHAAEPVPGLAAGGQPSLAHLTALREAGCRAVLDMRDPMEQRPYRAPDAVTAAGLGYHSFPLPHDPGNVELLASLRSLVAELLAEGPLYAHCSSGNRTGAALIPFLMLDRGMNEDEAMMAGMQIGARDAGLIEWALEYAREPQG